MTADGPAALFDAIRRGDDEAVAAALDAEPALASARDASGASTIQFALYFGRTAAAERLSAAGLPLAFCDAVALGRTDEVSRALDDDPARANVVAGDGFPALALAAFFGRPGVVELLLARGADVNAVANNASGFTALTGAVTRGDLGIVTRLLAHGADARHRYGGGLTPLHIASVGGRVDLAELLLAHGADPSARTDAGATPLALAIEKDRADVAALLRARGAIG